MYVLKPTFKWFISRSGNVKLLLAKACVQMVLFAILQKSSHCPLKTTFNWFISHSESGDVNQSSVKAQRGCCPIQCSRFVTYFVFASIQIFDVVDS